MKKLLILTSAILFLAAACNKQPVQPGQNTDQTANWKTYTSDEFGYVVKVPKDWEVQAVQSDDAFFTSQSLSKNPKTPDIIFTNTSYLDKVQGDVKKETINGVAFSIYTAGFRYNNILRTHYETSNGSKVYDFVLINTSERPTLLKILSTFKFTK